MNEDEKMAAVAMFVRALGTSQREALAILAAGHSSIEEIAYVPLEELYEVAGMEKARILALREQARQHLRVQ